MYLSNVPKLTSKRELVRVSGMRWPVETAIEECKGELGMDHYETRSWRGWRHRMTMTLVAHHFLVRLRLRLQKTPALTVTQVRELLTVMLPRRGFDIYTALAMVQSYQRHDHIACLAHRKRTLKRLRQWRL